MRATSIVMASLVSLAALMALATPADAVALCVAGAVHPVGYPPCHYVLCYGYTDGAWQGCQYPLPDPCDPTSCD